MQALLMQFLPLMVIQSVYALVVFLMARKRGVNVWLWTIGALVPFVGMFVSLVFFILTMLSMLDRLNALENKATFS